jgi:EmrB/QacA subfamily drug resistance transporter
MTDSSSQQSQAPFFTARHSNIVLSIVVIGTMMGAVDVTIVLLAFPSITRSLHADFLTSIWIILAYLLIIAVTTTQLGRLGDIYGRSRMFNLGFAIFTVGSALCGFSGNIESLIAFRVLQAFGGSIMQSNAGAIIADVFPPNRRGRAFGYNSLGFTAGAMLGIVLGGIITTYVSWQYIFFINIPIGIVAVIAGLTYLKDAMRIKAKINIPGMILLAAALTSFSLGATYFSVEGLSPRNAAFTVGGIILLAAFLIYDRRLKIPTIPTDVFREPILRNSLAAAFFVSLGYFSVVFLVIMYLQGVRGLTPLNASLLLVPGYVAGSFLGPIMGRLSDKYGSRRISTIGVIFMGAAILIYLTMRANTPLTVVLGASAVAGVGTSMFYPANFAAVMANVKPGSFGSVSGLQRTLQNIGTLGSFVLALSVAAASIPRSVAFQIFLGTLTGGVNPEFIGGIDTAFYVSLAILTLAGILSYFRGKDIRQAIQNPPDQQTSQSPT